MTGSTFFGLNQPLNNWNVSNVKDMSCMFKNASSFNQPLHAPWYVV
jgi:surface protein